MQSSYPEQYSTVSRRPLDIEDYLDILRRHKAWIAAPMFAALVLAVVVAFLWPDTYVSSATIRVVPAQIPETYVPTNINVQMSQRINAMYQTISSRANLTNIINLYNLYPKDKQRKPMEDIVEQMHRSIGIGNVTSVSRGTREEVSAFQITFKYQDRIIAQKVTADLVSRFISENTRERTTHSIQTTQFLKDQLETARKKLEAIEEKLANFRQTFQGRLPDQIQQNQMQLSAMEHRVSNMNNSLSRVAQEKMLLESDLRSLKSQRASLTPPPDVLLQRQKNSALGQYDREIARLENTLANLRERYRDSHPDVARIQSMLTVAQRAREKVEKEEQAAEKSASEAATVPVQRYDRSFDREIRSLDATIERIETQIKTKDTEAEDYRKSIQAAERQIRVIQTRIEAAPMSEQQYAEVVRDREVAKREYDEMNRKSSQSAIAEELERRQQGEMLELLNSASLPQSPTLPNRPMIIGGGAALGLVVGLALAGAREAKDTALKNLKDVRAYTQLTILGSVPLLENDLVVRRRKRLTWLAWSTACLVGILIMTGAVFYYMATNV